MKPDNWSTRKPCFRLTITEDWLEPEYPVGSEIIMDPNIEPQDHQLCYVRFHFGKGPPFEMVTVYRAPNGHDEYGRFCKRGSPKEALSFSPAKVTRAQLADGFVEFLGVEVGQLIGDAKLVS